MALQNIVNSIIHSSRKGGLLPWRFQLQEQLAPELWRVLAAQARLGETHELLVIPQPLPQLLLLAPTMERVFYKFV